MSSWMVTVPDPAARGGSRRRRLTVEEGPGTLEVSGGALVFRDWEGVVVMGLGVGAWLSVEPVK